MPKKTLSRRDFLKITGITLGTSVVACSGLTALATHSPAITLPESTYGDQNMSKKILITYASKCGSTGEVASAIGKTLAQTGVRVDVLPLRKVTNLSDYQAVFVGSAIRMGKWLREAADFVGDKPRNPEARPHGVFHGVRNHDRRYACQSIQGSRIH